MKQRRYVASGRPRTSYEIARVMGLSKRDAKKLARWTQALVRKVLAEIELEEATAALRRPR